MATDDQYSMTADRVDDYVRRICISYSLLRRQFEQQQATVEQLLNDGEVTAAIREMLQVYRLSPRLIQQVGYSAAIEDAAAVKISLVGSQQELLQGKLRVGDCVLYFRQSKQELLRLPRPLFLHMIAHELAHIRMRIDRHRLRESEFATDVLALLVVGDAKSFLEHVRGAAGRYGYIREELHAEVFKSLQRYAEVVYL